MSKCAVNCMTREDILDTLSTLSRTSGLYCRIRSFLSQLKEEDPEQYEKYMEHLVQQHFQDPVDLVLYFES